MPVAVRSCPAALRSEAFNGTRHDAAGAAAFGLTSQQKDWHGHLRQLDLHRTSCQPQDGNGLSLGEMEDGLAEQAVPREPTTSHRARKISGIKKWRNTRAVSIL